MKHNFFEGCCDLNTLKKRYYELAKMYHPDAHPEMGDEIMKEINGQYSKLTERFSHVSADGRTEATEEEAREAADLAEEFRAVVYKIINLDDISIEICGAWLWVSGDTFKHRASLKAAGLCWANKKKMWYWHPADAVCGHSGKSIEKIREKYGSKSVKSDSAFLHFAR